MHHASSCMASQLIMIILSFDQGIAINRHASVHFNVTVQIVVHGDRISQYTIHIYSYTIIPCMQFTDCNFTVLPLTVNRQIKFHVKFPCHMVASYTAIKVKYTLKIYFKIKEIHQF